jgi:two-component sensor histidine kinase
LNASVTPLPALLKTGTKSARLSRTGVTALAAALVAVIGCFDYLTGDFSMAVFYLVPVAFATWFAGRESGWSISLLSAAAWFVGNIATSNRASDYPVIHIWNAAVPALFYVIVVQLLSALHRVQTELEERIERRTISLAEVHHRVKNNLQIISSLLMLQAEKLSNSDDKAVFGECRDRIHSMARLHEQLYSKGRFDHLDFAAHLQEMARMLVRSHTPPGCALTLALDTAPVSIDLDTAVTLGLVANELILNALKHAFVGRPSGRLTVEMHAGDPNRMTVCDDGRGLPPGFDAGNNAGLGTELVLGMTRQLRGEAKIENDPAGGTRATISFPSLPPSKTGTQPKTKSSPHD